MTAASVLASIAQYLKVFRRRTVDGCVGNTNCSVAMEVEMAVVSHDLGSRPAEPAAYTKGMAVGLLVALIVWGVLGALAIAYLL